jgi:hypothetical protein
VKPPAILGSIAALAFALAPQSSAAALTPPGTTVAVHASVAAGAGGNVTVVVPGASIARADGVDATIERGHAYRAEFLIWVAPNARKATLVVQSHGAVLNSCMSAHVRPGTTSAVLCLVRAGAKTSGNRASIDVVVRTNLGTVSRTFAHVLSH